MSSSRLAWFPASQWPSELGRVGVLPEDLPVRASTVPPYIDVPFELADAAAEAARSGRSDLVPILAAQATGEVVDADGVPLSELEINSVLRALSLESQGRLRALVADVSGDETTRRRRRVVDAALRRLVRPPPAQRRGSQPGAHRTRRPLRPGHRARARSGRGDRMTQERLNPDQLAAGEEAQFPTTASEEADLTDKYDRMLRLADQFDRSGDEMRARARLGEDILRDEAVSASADLSKATYTAGRRRTSARPPPASTAC